MTMKAEGEPREYLYNVFEVHLGIHVAQFLTGWHMSRKEWSRSSIHVIIP